MSVITITRLYDLLSIKLGKETAENLTNFIENKINQELESKNLATKEYIRAEISGAKADIIKWMFIFWIGQGAVTFGIISLFFKY